MSILCNFTSMFLIVIVLGIVAFASGELSTNDILSKRLESEVPWRPIAIAVVPDIALLSHSESAAKSMRPDLQGMLRESLNNPEITDDFCKMFPQVSYCAKKNEAEGRRLSGAAGEENDEAPERALFPNPWWGYMDPIEYWTHFYYRRLNSVNATAEEVANIHKDMMIGMNVTDVKATDNAAPKRVLFPNPWWGYMDPIEYWTHFYYRRLKSVDKTEESTPQSIESLKGIFTDNLIGKVEPTLQSTTPATEKERLYAAIAESMAAKSMAPRIIYLEDILKERPRPPMGYAAAPPKKSAAINARLAEKFLGAL